MVGGILRRDKMANSGKLRHSGILKNQRIYLRVKIADLIPYRGKISRGKFLSGKNLVTSEKLVTFPRLIFEIRHFSPTNF